MPSFQSKQHSGRKERDRDTFWGRTAPRLKVLMAGRVHLSRGSGTPHDGACVRVCVCACEEPGHRGLSMTGLSSTAIVAINGFPSSGAHHHQEHSRMAGRDPVEKCSKSTGIRKFYVVSPRCRSRRPFWCPPCVVVSLCFLLGPVQIKHLLAFSRSVALWSYFLWVWAALEQQY